MSDTSPTNLLQKNLPFEIPIQKILTNVASKTNSLSSISSKSSDSYVSPLPKKT